MKFNKALKENMLNMGTKSPKPIKNKIEPSMISNITNKISKLSKLRNIEKFIKKKGLTGKQAEAYRMGSLEKIS